MTKPEEIRALAEKIYAAGFASDIGDPRAWAKIAIEAAETFATAWLEYKPAPNPSVEIKAAALMNEELRKITHSRRIL
jgi:hypothetical protein